MQVPELYELLPEKVLLYSHILPCNAALALERYLSPLSLSFSPSQFLFAFKTYRARTKLPSSFWEHYRHPTKDIPPAKVYDAPDVEIANMKFYDAPKIDITDVEFVEIMKQTDRSFLCRARWQGKDCVLKVSLPYKPDTCESVFIITRDLFKNESRVYSRLKAGGFCERGSVPDLYGVVENIDPEAKGWQPQLKKFYDETFPKGLDPKARPSGVLIEYIPDLNMIDISNYTEQRAQRLKQLLAEIHKARIVHLDTDPRNMLIQGDSDRVLWIDYELSEIYDPAHSEHPRYFAWERENMDHFIEKLGRDHKLGEYKETRNKYFD